MRSRVAGILDWIWPDISNPKGAEKAANTGVAACGFVACLFWTTVIASIVHPFYAVDYDPWVAADAIMFTIAAWRVGEFSRLWAIVALTAVVADICLLAASGNWALALIGSVILQPMIIGVRGTFAYHHLRQSL